MTDLNPLNDQNEPPEDVATLYSWANLHGAKYRDFSAARAQTREKARLRAEQALIDEQRLHQAGEATPQSAGEVLAPEGQVLPALHVPSGEPLSDAQEAHAAELQHRADLAADLAADQAAREHELAQQQAAEQARLAAEEHARLEAAEKGRLEAAENERLAAEEYARHEAAEQARLEAEEHARLEAAEQARLAEERAAEEAQEAARQAAKQNAEREAAQLAAQKLAAQEAEKRAAEESARRVAQAAAARAAQQAAEQAEREATRAAEERAAERAAQQRIWHSPRPENFTSSYTAQSASYASPQAAPVQSAPSGAKMPNTENPNQVTAIPAAEPSRASATQRPLQPQYSQVRQEQPMPSSNPWAANESQEPVGRPAWLNTDRNEAPASATQPAQPLPQTQPLTQTPDDTLQGSRDRLTSRWFALRGIFDGAPQVAEAAPAPVVSRAPAIGVFSLAGGVGKTSLVATLGRALSARGERVLLVDTAAFGLLPFFFGATDQRPGTLRTFNHPGVSSDAPIQLVTLDPDGMGADTPSPESLSGEIQKFSRGASRVIIDLATASGATTRRILRMSPLVLVPVIPDMNSVVSVSSIDAFFEHNSNPSGRPSMPVYLLNQFDASLPLHLDVREVLREQLGDRLLPFALRRTPAMSEALAEGMTVMDYAPGSPLAEDFSTLAGWVKSVSAPATTSYRGVRWSEQ